VDVLGNVLGNVLGTVSRVVAPAPAPADAPATPTRSICRIRKVSRIPPGRSISIAAKDTSTEDPSEPPSSATRIRCTIPSFVPMYIVSHRVPPPAATPSTAVIRSLFRVSPLPGVRLATRSDSKNSNVVPRDDDPGGKPTGTPTPDNRRDSIDHTGPLKPERGEIAPSRSDFGS